MVQSSHEHDHQRGDGERGHHHRRFDAVTHPGNGDVARAVGEPDKTGRQHRDRQQEGDDPDHCAPALGPKRARRLGGVFARGVERGLARLRLGDPGLRRRACRVVELAEIGERRRNVGLRRVDLKTRQHGGRLVTGRRGNRTDAHQSADIGLQPLEEAALRR